MISLRKAFSTFLLFIVLAFVGLVFSFPSFYVVPVITYHSIGEPLGTYSRINAVSSQSFARQMDFLVKRGYRVLSMEDYVKGLSSGNNFCCRSAVITFDDGLLDNYTNALPVLEKHRFPAVFFVKAAPQIDKGDMSLAQVKEAASRGVTIGSHTLNHPYLPDATTAQKMQELAGSKKALEGLLGVPVNYLAYPIGGYDDETKAIAREAGYRAAFTTNRGPGRFNHDLFALKRVRLKSGDSDLILWAKLSGFYNFFREIKKPSGKEE